MSKLSLCPGGVIWNNKRACRIQRWNWRRAVRRCARLSLAIPSKLFFSFLQFFRRCLLFDDHRGSMTKQNTVSIIAPNILVGERRERKNRRFTFSWRCWVFFWLEIFKLSPFDVFYSWASIKRLKSGTVLLRRGTFLLLSIGSRDYSNQLLCHRTPVFFLLCF